MKKIIISEKSLLFLMLDCYSSWVSYGQLTMEEEREQEELFDAFNWSAFAKKFAMPTNPVERRQLHSEKWFECKRQEAKDIYNLMKKYIK
jgi:hypothetical protein